MFEFDSELAEKLTTEEIEEYSLDLNPLSKRALKAFEVLSDECDNSDNFIWNYVINEYSLSEYSNLSKKLLDLIFNVSWAIENKKEGPRYSLGVLYCEDLSRKQLRQAVEYHTSGIEYESSAHTFRLAIDRIIEKGIDIRIQIAIVKNHMLLEQLVQTPRILNMVFPSRMLLLKLIFKYYYVRAFRDIHFIPGENARGSRRYLSENILTNLSLSTPLTKEEIDYVYYTIGLQGKRFYRYQLLSYEKLIEFCFSQEEARVMATYFENDISEPIWTRKDDIKMTYVNMPEKAAFRCVTAKKEIILLWLSLVGPKTVLPTLLGMNKETDAFISKRLAETVDDETYRRYRNSII